MPIPYTEPEDALSALHEPRDFYAASRFTDVERGPTDKNTLSKARSSVLEMIKANDQSQFPDAQRRLHL